MRAEVDGNGLSAMVTLRSGKCEQFRIAVRQPGQIALDQLGGDGAEGDAVAAEPEHGEAALGARDAADRGKPVLLSPKEPAQANAGLVSTPGSSLPSLRADRGDLLLDQRIALLCVGELLVLAADDDAAVPRGAQVEIGIGRLPDQAARWPEPIGLQARSPSPRSR